MNCSIRAVIRTTNQGNDTTRKVRDTTGQKEMGQKAVLNAVIRYKLGTVWPSEDATEQDGLRSDGTRRNGPVKCDTGRNGAG